MHKTFKRFLQVSAASLLLSTASAAWAGSATFSVPGTSNPFLAGQPAGSCCGGDSAPAESPVYAGAVAGGATLTFSNTSGGVSYVGGMPTDGPGGNAGYLIDTPDYEGGLSVINGIAGYQNAPIDALVGVFLSSNSPTTNPATTMLDFSVSTATPGLQQIFYIGTGGTVTAPIGATRLYLGTVDGYGWYNDTGAIEVTVGGLGSAVPEPAAWAMMILGLSAVGVVLRRRRVALAA